MKKGIKFRAYPNKGQQNLINRTFGCCRLIYNKGLAMRNDAYENGSKVGFSQTSAMVTELKKTSDFAFLKEVDSIALWAFTHASFLVGIARVAPEVGFHAREFLASSITA